MRSKRRYSTMKVGGDNSWIWALVDRWHSNHIIATYRRRWQARNNAELANDGGLFYIERERKLECRSPEKT